MEVVQISMLEMKIGNWNSSETLIHLFSDGPGQESHYHEVEAVQGWIIG